MRTDLHVVREKAHDLTYYLGNNYADCPYYHRLVVVMHFSILPCPEKRSEQKRDGESAC